MNAYTTYDYYSNEYSMGEAVVDSADFSKLLIQAQSIIDLYTFNRLNTMTDIPEAVQNCCCELIELLQENKERQSTSSGIASEKNNNYSVTYESSEDLNHQLESNKTMIVNKWLSNTGLMYRGC